MRAATFSNGISVPQAIICSCNDPSAVFLVILSIIHIYLAVGFSVICNRNCALSLVFELLISVYSSSPFLTLSNIHMFSNLNVC